MRLHAIVTAAAVCVFALTSAAVAKDWTEVRLGTEGAYPPFNGIDSGGKLIGFDIDIGNLLCERMKVKCTWVAQDWDGIIPALIAGKYDAIIASMSITEERKKLIAFTDKYYQTPLSIVAAKNSTIKDWSPEGMKGKTMGAQGSTTQGTFLEDIYKPAGVEVKLYPTADEANADLAAGRLDAVVSDKLPLMDWIAKPDGACCDIKLDIDKEKFKAIIGEGAGIAVRLEDTELRDKFNKALAEILADGSYKALNDKYFPFSIY